MRRLISLLFMLALVAGPTVIGHAQTSAAPAGERHPEIHRALHALENAKNDLGHAAHDFGGHRAKALEHVDAAISELRMALASDRH